MGTRSGDVAFEASAFRIDAFDVSEFQATGELIPEPASLLLMGTGLVGIARRRLRRV